MNTIPRGQTPKQRAYQKAYRESHPKRDRRLYKAAYDAANKEKNAAYRVANRDTHRVQNAAWYATNRERVLTKIQARYTERRQELAAYGRRYYAENTDQMKANAARRKARVRGADGSHTLAEWRAKCVECDHRCVYCGGAVPLTRDHVVAVANGGTDYIENIVPACAPCNSSKRTRSAEDFGRTNHSRSGGIGGESCQ